MPDKKLEKLNKLLELVQNDTITPKEIEQFLLLVLGFVSKAKDEFNSLSQANLQVIRDSISYIEDNHKEFLASLDGKVDSKVASLINEIKSNSKTLETSIDEVKSLLKEVQAIEVKHGKDADEEKIVAEVLALIPEQKETILDGGEEIVEKINELPTDNDDLKIDWLHIKNAPEFKGKFGGSTARNLYQLLDVVITDPTDTQVLTYDAANEVWKNEDASGGGGGGSVYVNGNKITNPDFIDSSEIELDVTGSDISLSLVAGSVDETKLDASVNASLDLADSAVQNVVTSLGYTPEDVANLSTDLTASATKYPSVNAVNTGLATKQSAILIATATASNSAVIDFTLPTGYDYFELFINNIIPQTASTSFLMRASIDGGATFLAGGTDYQVQRDILTGGGGTTYAPSFGSASSIAPIGALLGNAAGRYFRGSFKIFKPDDATNNKRVTGEFAMSRVDGQPAMITLTASVITTSAVNAIRLLMSSGNITSGQFILYGYK